MRAVNETRGTELMAFGRRAASFWDRSRGLLGQGSLPPGGGLLLDPCSGIHMFFMRFPIDAIFIDRDGLVVHLAKNIGPWRMSRYIFRARAVLELPAGTIQDSRTQIGDRLVFEG